ncbi:hypothetical protein AAG565_03320 [Fontimonas sp. SYSU GA230001]|uniref:hypothetical protein n=1 Tax=Fontimonas sp. SYSU GA230001 TaxID=3142450 RepID=UPI0032B6220E
MTHVHKPGLAAGIAALGLVLAAHAAQAADTKVQAETRAETRAVTKADGKVPAEQRRNYAGADEELDPESLQAVQENEARFAPAATPAPIDLAKLKGEEKKLAERVKARWDALIAFDLKKLYGFATPSYRKAHDQNYFNAQYQNRIARKSATIVDLAFDDDKKTQARVTVRLDFDIFTASMPMAAPLPSVSWEKETWVKVDGQWWFVEPR